MDANRFPLLQALMPFVRTVSSSPSPCVVIDFSCTVTAPKHYASPEVTRVHLKENAVSCFTISSVQPIYPREARLAHIEGVVKLAIADC